MRTSERKISALDNQARDAHPERGIWQLDVQSDRRASIVRLQFDVQCECVEIGCSDRDIIISVEAYGYYTHKTCGIDLWNNRLVE